jgi:hypothetical protein
MRVERRVQNTTTGYLGHWGDTPLYLLEFEDERTIIIPGDGVRTIALSGDENSGVFSAEIEERKDELNVNLILQWGLRLTIGRTRGYEIRSEENAS